MTPAAESLDRPALAAKRITAYDLLGDSYDEHVHLTTFHDPWLYPLPITDWTIAWARAGLDELRGQIAALQAEWRETQGDGR